MHADSKGVADVAGPFGVRVHLNWIHVYSPEDRAKALSMIREAGIDCVSFGFNWGSIEPVKGQFFFQFYDTLVEECREAGLEIEGVVGYSSEWASSAPADAEKRWIWPPKDARDYANFVRRLVKHYAGRIRYWEFWNEPNNTDFFYWQDGGYPEPEPYLEFLRPAYRTAKEANPECRVLLGGLAGNGVRGRSNVTEGWLERFYKLGGSDSFDIMNIHPYPLRAFGDVVEQVEATRKLMKEYGDTEKPIWITEMNGRSQPDSPYAAGLTDIYTRLLKLEYVEHIMWYNFRDKGPSDAPSWETTGLVRLDFTPIAEYREYAELTRTHGKD